MWVREPLHKLHVLAPGLIEPGAFAKRLELNRGGGREPLLLSEVADGHRLHGLVGLHQQLPDLLKNGRLDVEEVPVSVIGLVHAAPVVGLSLHGLNGGIVLHLLSLVQLKQENIFKTGAVIYLLYDFNQIMNITSKQIFTGNKR